MTVVTDRLAAAVAAFRRGDLEQASGLCRQALQAQPGRTQAWVLEAKLAQSGADFPLMLQACRRAVALEPNDSGIVLLLAEALVLNAQLAQARVLIEELAQAATQAADWAAIGRFFTSSTDYRAALEAFQRAAELAPDDPAAQANLASALATTGDAGAAERVLNNLLESHPLDADAHYNRAVLRRVSPEDNHIEDMRRALSAGPREESPLCYALAKEYEDCGDHTRAWQHLARGAGQRRARLGYDVARDEEAMLQIAEQFDARWCQRVRNGDARPDGFERGPLFVLGLPRSGTTLVDRILASHSQVASLGEINDFAFALMRAAGPHTGKSELIARTAAMDLAAVGKSYRASTAQYGGKAICLVDKTPMNFLYLGLIAAALPGVRIVHLRRHPMASCYALYKTLFRMACPFSYDLEDLARYYIAYDRLMAHWRSLPGVNWLDLDYETLVQQPEPAARELLDYCGLPWESGCLEFHRNSAPVATASAAQVRQPIHSRSVDLWRHHGDALSPLAARLRAAGIDVD
ncbi:hypothetical protein CWI75_00500 [Kineobactrum sediminis]|uniref:Cytochrome c-type biogenesis protein H TPR domain-containing protein n=1 Tax=Kineobactrum sediminis TaxID=1905677 RepID=A0A2N5Y669_9GAMM|nr:sulfotransferase [Kineobactrum sediminis]PLW83876.1 hypothetical protein CWI75_00500 [Kineobactrum sediminis]